VAPAARTARPVRAVIFDLDGVIVDSEIWWDAARHAFAAAHGKSWTLDDRHAVMGANSRQWSETMKSRLGLDLPAEAIQRAIVNAMIERYEREGAPTIDDAIAAVRRTAAVRPVALASSSHRAVIDAALRATGLGDAFRAVVSSDEVSHGKPAPDVFLEAARRLGVEPTAILVVEDSLNGVRAAKAAGMTVVLVPNASIPPAPGATDAADLVLESLEELDVDAVSAAEATTELAEPRDAPAARDPGPSRLSRPAGVDPLVDRIHPIRRTIRTVLSRLLAGALCRSLFRPSLTGRERLPAGPAIYCANHLSWIDPFVIMATFPMRPRLMFFGPKEEDMTVGGRNRLMSWTGATIPYRPGKNDLLEATRRVHVAIAAGRAVVIFGEGRIQPFESHLRPLSEGAAYFALRERVPVVPVAIAGTSWLAFGRRLVVRIGDPIMPEGRAKRDGVDALTERCRVALAAMVAPNPAPTRPGRFGRWLTELFNDWPEGSREAAEAAERERTAPPG
jgi:HAD superfamily hydrolase (TIGR01509 family)